MAKKQTRKKVKKPTKKNKIEKVKKFEKIITEKAIYVTNLLRSQKLMDKMLQTRREVIDSNVKSMKDYVEQMIDGYSRLAGEPTNGKEIAMVASFLHAYTKFGPFIATVKKRPASVSELLQQIVQTDFKEIEKPKIVLMSIPLLAFTNLLDKIQDLPIENRIKIYNLMLDTRPGIVPYTTTVEKK